MPSSTAVPPKTPPSISSTAGHTLTGALIGVVELVPGVSGGTVALVLGVFDRLISSAHHLIGGFVHLLLGRDRSAGTRRLARVEWPLVLPLVVGMFLALFALSGPLHTFIDTQPVVASALFLGMVSASLLVPITMVRDVGPARTASMIGGAVVVLGVAVAVFWLLSLPSVQIESPAGWVIAVSGAAAVCALALPGLSGSFILLTFGMYEPTLEAVSTRDGGYLALFMAGAVLGLVSVVQVLAYLLRAHRRPVLLAAIGLILGSLRALWPWQDAGVLQAPGDDWIVPLLACLGGATFVLLLWSKERRAARKSVAARALTPCGDDRIEADSDRDHQEGRA